MNNSQVHLNGHSFTVLELLLYCNYRFNLQGSSSPVGRNVSSKALNPRPVAKPLPKPFLQLNHGSKAFLHQQQSVPILPRLYRGLILAESRNRSWDLGRFFKTLYFFNGPPSPAKVDTVSTTNVLLYNMKNLVVF